MVRCTTSIEDETVYVTDGQDRLRIGDLDQILEMTGGPAWTISYSDAEKSRYSDLDTADEGLTIDVVDTINAMTFDETFVDALDAQPVDPIDDDTLSPRMGLFVGRLLENLEYGVR